MKYLFAVYGDSSRWGSLGEAAEAKEWAAKFPLVGPGGFDSIEIRPIASDEDSRRRGSE